MRLLIRTRSERNELETGASIFLSTQKAAKLLLAALDFCLEKLVSASWIPAWELHVVTAPCVGSASLVATGFDSINEQLNLIKAAKPISITRLRVAPVALGFSCSLISRGAEEKGI